MSALSQFLVHIFLLSPFHIAWSQALNRCSQSNSQPPCGRGVEYIHRDPRVVGSDEKGSLEFEKVKYVCESDGTRTREWLRWCGPVAIVNNRPVLLSERAPHIIKPATVWQ
jgi:hypothetical protein